MNEREMDTIVLRDGLRELDLQVKLMKSWVEQEIWAEAGVHARNVEKLMQGMRKVFTRLRQLGRLPDEADN